MRALFGTPVDESTIAVRTAPGTSLVIAAPEASFEAQAFVALPASAPALSLAEVESLRQFYAWDRGESTWWQTQRPARFRLEQVTRDLYAGHLLERGMIVAAGDDPARVPQGAGHFFRAFRSPPSSPILDPCGPVVRRVDGAPELVLATTATRTLLATFPCFGSEVTWLRLYSQTPARAAFLDALESELQVLRRLHELRPGSVAEVLHEGWLETTDYQGRYAAFRQPLGIPIEGLTRVLSDPAEQRACVRNVAVGVADLLREAHRQRLCLGPLAPCLVRVRYSQRSGTPHLATTLVALPASGEVHQEQPPSVLELFPPVEGERLLDQFDSPYKCSHKNDLRALARLIEELLNLARAPAAELAPVIQALDRGDPAALEHELLHELPPIQRVC